MCSVQTVCHLDSFIEKKTPESCFTQAVCDVYAFLGEGRMMGLTPMIRVLINSHINQSFWLHANRLSGALLLEK